jgi:hypothetical protein
LVIGLLQKTNIKKNIKNERNDMKKASVNRGKTLKVLGLVIGLAVAVMFSPNDMVAAPGGTGIVQFISETDMTNTGVNPDASGKINVTASQGNDNNHQQLNISLANLDPNTTYQLIAFIGDDTNAMSIAGFTTDQNGTFTVSYMEKSRGKPGPHMEQLPNALDPMCIVRELDIVNGSADTVLRGVLASPDQWHYLVTRSMNNTGFLPAAVGDLLILGGPRSTLFWLRASGLTPRTQYSLTINGSVVQTSTSDKKGKLNLTKLPPGSPDVLDIHMLALTDGSGSNIVLTIDGLGVPCSTTTGAITPTVSSIIPTNTATAVPINSKLAVTFSEAMNPATITNTTFTLQQGITTVTGTVSYVSGTATFAPATALTNNTLYTATITTGAMDLAGNALASDFVWSFTTGASTDTNRPTVIATNPTNTAMNVAVNQTVNATFSKAMDPATITKANFTLTGPGATTVTGTVAYVAASRTATFTPESNLALNTTYTNTITTGVEDLANNGLTTSFVWSFTTGTQIVTNLMSINLGRASTFAIMATAAISGSGNHITGDVGLHPGSAQGIAPSEINGTIHVNDQAIINAQADLLAAYNEAVSRSVNAQTLQGNLGGLTKTPGLYVNSSSTGISGTGANAILTLDAQGDANAVFIFKMGSTLVMGTGTSIVLSGGAQAKNVYWQVGSSATLGTTSIFKGNILAAVTITVNNGAAVEGRLFAGSGGGGGAVTVQSSTITIPAP